MKFKKIFVTVGTTEFDQLIKLINQDDILNIIKNHLGCERLTLQIGKGEEIGFKKTKGIEIEMFTLKSSILEDIRTADLVIYGKYD
jgi:UDP-N-acetylglucosamine transferase subunit ALG13